MTEQTNNQQVQQQGNSLTDVIANQRATSATFSQDLNKFMTNVIDSWARNFTTVDKIKNKRTDQLNYIIGFVNQLSTEGMTTLTQIGGDIKDPELSNKILECNNNLMMAARNLLANIQKDEEGFQKEMQALAIPQNQTEVKASEI